MYSMNKKRDGNLRALKLLFLIILSSCYFQKNSINGLQIFSRKPKTLKLSDEMGVSSFFPFQNRFFDPFGLANENNFATYREAELKHGRVAMIATIGMFIPDILQDNNILQNIQKQMYLSPSYDLKFIDIPYGLKAIQVVPWIGWLQLIIALGILETTVFIQRNPNDMPGDYQVGYFGLIDKGRHEKLLHAELENGRVAMVAFAAQVLFELFTDVTVGEGWRNILN